MSSKCKNENGCKYYMIDSKNCAYLWITCKYCKFSYNKPTHTLWHTKSTKMDESLQCIECERTFFDMYKITKNKVFKKMKKSEKKTQNFALLN